jgi:hypothetical protein
MNNFEKKSNYQLRFFFPPTLSKQGDGSSASKT